VDDASLLTSADRERIGLLVLDVRIPA